MQSITHRIVRVSPAVITCALSVLMTQPSSAAWIGASSGTGYADGGDKDYNTTTNWAGGTIDDSFAGFSLTGDLTAYLDVSRTTTAGVNLDYAGAFNLTLQSNDATTRTLTLSGDLSADTVAGGRTIRIGNTGAPVTLALGANQRTFTVGSTDTLIVQSITGTNGFIKAGTGVLELSTATTVTGTVLVNAGTMRYGVANAFAAPSLTVNNGGTLDMQTFSDTVGLVTLNHGGSIIGSTGVLSTGTTGLTSTGGTVTFSDAAGGITLSGGASLSPLTYLTDSGNETTLSYNGTLRFGTGGKTFSIADGVQAIDVDINGVVGGGTNHNLTKSGAGTLQFSGTASNAYGSGSMNVQDGTLSLNKTGAAVNALGSGALTVGDSTGSANSAVVRYATGSNNDQIQNGTAVTVNSDGLLDFNNHSDTIASLTVNGGSVTIGTGVATISTTTATTMTGGSISSTGAGKLVMGGNVSSLANATAATISGTLDLNIAGAGTRNFSVADGAAAVDLDISAAIINGNVGTGTLAKTGDGLLRLSGNSTYSAATTISAGTLQLGASNVLPNTTAVTLTTGTFDVQNFNDTIASLTVNGGSVIGTGTITATSAAYSISGPGNSTISANLAGDVGLTKGAVVASVLSGNNTYTGATNVNNGSLSISSLNSVVGGSASSSLGAPVTEANGTIGLGNAATAGTLIYTGAGETTDRVINLRGSSGSAILDQSGTGALVFTSNLTATGVGSKTFILQGSTAGTGEIAGAIVNNDSLNVTNVTKDGSGKWTLSGLNTYTGATTITAGTLAVNGTLDAASAVAVNGGTLAGSGTIGGTVNVAAGATLAPGNSIGTLTINNTLTLDGSSTSDFEIDDVLDISDLVAGITTLTYGGTLNVTNLGDDSGYYHEQVFDLFDFASQSGTFAAVNLPTLPVGYTWKLFGADLIDYSTGEIVVLVPEPASLALMLAGALLMVPYRGRGRREQV